MNDKKLDEKLQLLNKSYDRMPQYLDVDALMNKIEEEEQINTEPLQKPKRKPLYMTWGVAAAAVFLSGVLVSPWILQQENSTTDEVNITQRNIDENASLDVATTNDSFSNDPHFTAEDEMTPAELDTYRQDTRVQMQQELGLSKSRFEELPYMQQEEAYWQSTKPMLEKYELTAPPSEVFFYLATPRQIIEQATSQYYIQLDDYGIVDVAEQLSSRLEQLVVAYNAELVVTTDRDALIQAAQQQGIVLEDGEFHFRTYEFMTMNDNVDVNYPHLDQYLTFVEFDEPLYEGDDLRYAPEDILPHFSAMTQAIMNMPINNSYTESLRLEYAIATTRLLKGTDSYPLTTETLQAIISSSDTFAELAMTISLELQQSGKSATAEALTYDMVESMIESSRLRSPDDYSSEVNVWNMTTDYKRAAELNWSTWTIEQAQQLDAINIVMYYLFKNTTDDAATVAQLAPGFDVIEGMWNDNITLHYSVLSDEFIKAKVVGYLAQGEALSVQFEKKDGHWQRTQ